MTIKTRTVSEAWEKTVLGCWDFGLESPTEYGENANEILVMSKNGIAERGTHNELMKIENGIYKSLYLAQSSGYLQDENNGNENTTV